MTIRFEEKVSIENAQFVCQWSNSLGKSFQEQWMGPRINQARRQQSSYREIFYQPPETGARLR
ncbi:GNAT family acetyltransferase [Streptococcus pneumoniae]|nr:GNAT family acetyltransferase [Streptococcus pneumoniae]